MKDQQKIPRENLRIFHLIAFLLLVAFSCNLIKPCLFTGNNEHAFLVREANDSVIASGLAAAVVFDSAGRASTRSHFHSRGSREIANRFRINYPAVTRGPCEWALDPSMNAQGTGCRPRSLNSSITAQNCQPHAIAKPARSSTLSESSWEDLCQSLQSVGVP